MASPTDEQYQELYAIAQDVLAAAPWNTLLEDLMFAIGGPHGIDGYVSVMGAAGTHFAIALYMTEQGLNNYERIARADNRDPYSILELPQLQASFESRQDVRPGDRETMKRLGLKFRGKFAYPVFSIIQEDRLSWYIEDAHVELLADAMRQTLIVAEAYRNGTCGAFRTRENKVLARTWTAQAGKRLWSQTYLPVPPPPPPPDIPFNTAAAAVKAARLPSGKDTWELSLRKIPAPIQESNDDPPQFPTAMFIIDRASGLILNMDLLTPDPTRRHMLEGASLALMNMLLNVGVKPREVRIADGDASDWLAPALRLAGVNVTEHKKLPKLDRVFGMLLTQMPGSR